MKAEGGTCRPLIYRPPFMFRNEIAAVYLLYNVE